MEQLKKKVEALEREILILRGQVDALFLKQGTSPVETIIFENSGQKITLQDVKAYLGDYDLSYIKQVLKVICEHYAGFYEYLPFAVKKWLEIDPARPAGENEFLLSKNLPPVAEQIRLFPGKAAKDKDYFSMDQKPVLSIRQQEEIWKQEQQASESAGKPTEKTEIIPKRDGKNGNNNAFRENYQKKLQKDGIDSEKLRSIKKG